MVTRLVVAALLLHTASVSAVHGQASSWDRFPVAPVHAPLSGRPFGPQQPEGSTGSAVLAGVALGGLAAMTGYFLGREVHSAETGAALGAVAEGFALPVGVAHALHRSGPGARSRVLSLVFAGVGFGIFAVSRSDTSLAVAAAVTPLLQLPIVVAIERGHEND